MSDQNNNNNSNNTNSNNSTYTSCYNGNGSQGNGGRGNNRGQCGYTRGNGSRNSNRRNNKKNHNKEKGATSEIESYVLDCLNRKAMEANKEHLEKILLYVGNTFGKSADNVKYVMKNLEDPDLEKPTEISESEAQEKLKFYMYQEEFKRYMD